MKDTANKKPNQECKAPPMVVRLFTGSFFSVVGNQAKNEEVFCHALYFYPDFDNSDCEND